MPTKGRTASLSFRSGVSGTRKICSVININIVLLEYKILLRYKSKSCLIDYQNIFQIPLQIHLSYLIIIRGYHEVINIIKYVFFIITDTSR